MRAVVFEEYGTADVLELKEIDKPTPKDDEVLVKVRAVSINDWDWQLLQGIPFANRVSFGLFKPKKNVLGSDIAGRIEAAGKNVKKFKPGDDVYGDLCGEWGGFAEYVCARENALELKPAGMTFVEAAAIPQACMLALQGLRDSVQIRSGQRLLINGAGGGMGTFAFQIAKLEEVEVTGVDSKVKLDMMRSMGFDRVIDYTEEDFTRMDRKYDLILDAKTNRSIFDYMRVLKSDGAYVTAGGSGARLIQALLLMPWIRMVSKKKLRIIMLKPNRDLAYLGELFEAGKLKPVIDGPYRLSELPDAMRHFGSGNHRGKVVIDLELDYNTQ
jgi:NADPH:quinone reductase-like Zn-dependent oxidoreductase